MASVTSDLSFSPKLAEQGAYGGGQASGAYTGLLSGIRDAVGRLSENRPSGGNIVIPVSIGGTLLDEIIVTAEQRQNLRSGGR